MAYYQNIHLQNNIKSVSHEFYHIADKAGKFGCASVKNTTYLHWSKSLGFASKHLVYEHNKPLLNATVFKKNDARLKNILPLSIFSKLKPDSDILYTVHARTFNQKKDKKTIDIYADCQDIFFVNSNDDLDYFYQHQQYDYIGELSVDCYFIALSKRVNNQSQAIYSLYRYNNVLGLQEVLEGVESLLMHSSSEKINNIKIVVNSVEGNPPLKTWLNIAI